MITKEQFLQFSEICNDAVICARLSKWEDDFISDIHAKLQQFGELTSLSEKQIEIINRIEQKVYAT